MFHLKRFVVQLDDSELVKYSIEPGSVKGDFTYRFFNLAGLEVNSFDQAQGQVSLNEVHEILREHLVSIPGGN
jgi:hypothetical protein